MPYREFFRDILNLSKGMGKYQSSFEGLNPAIQKLKKWEVSEATLRHWDGLPINPFPTIKVMEKEEIEEYLRENFNPEKDEGVVEYVEGRHIIYLGRGHSRQDIDLYKGEIWDGERGPPTCEVCITWGVDNR